LDNLHLEDQQDERVTLRWTFSKQVVRQKHVWNWFRIVSNGKQWY